MTSVRVRTAQELEDAVRSGSPHILIEQHLDLRSLTGMVVTTDGPVKLRIMGSTRSITGRCAAAPDDAVELTGYKPGQCVLYTDSQTMLFATPAAVHWVDNVFIRAARPAEDRQGVFNILQQSVRDVRTWWTDLAMQGDGGLVAGLDLTTAHALFADSTFDSFLWNSGPAGWVHTSDVRLDTTAVYERCTFTRNEALNGGDPIRRGVVTLNDHTNVGAHIDALFRDCTFVNNTGTATSADGNAHAWSTPTRLSYANTTNVLSTLREDGTPLVEDMPPDRFASLLTLEDADFVAIREASEQPTSTGASQPGSINVYSTPQGGYSGYTLDSTSETSQWTSWYPGCPAVPERDYDAAAKEAPPARAPQLPCVPEDTSATLNPSVTSLLRRQECARDGKLDAASNKRTTFLRSDTEPLSAGPVALPADVRLQLEAVLDELHESGDRFATIFTVHSFIMRRAGGQGIVQFVQRARDEAQFAVKFFFSMEGYEAELAHYENPKLKDIIVPPFMALDNSDGAIATESGYVFPPMIITERGEALNEWASRMAPDFPASIFVLLHIVEKLHALHAQGLCHRDIKPANTLWLPSANRWMLMDFGCAAAIGEEVPLAYSLTYAAPEIVAAAESGARTVIADAAVDIWALGVVAFELLTHSRAFAHFHPGAVSAAQTAEALLGRAPLPWEGAEGAGRVAALRALKRSVLQCLDRDARQRPTSAEVLGAWNGLFESVTGTTTAQYTLPEPHCSAAR